MPLPLSQQVIRTMRSPKWGGRTEVSGRRRADSSSSKSDAYNL